MSEIPDPPPGGPAPTARRDPSAPASGGLLGPWFEPVKIPRDAAETLRALSARGSLVFVMRSAGLLNYLFLGGRDLDCQDAADADDSGTLDVTDAVKLLAYLFLGGAALPAPGAEACGRDLTSDSLAPCTSTCR